LQLERADGAVLYSHRLATGLSSGSHRDSRGHARQLDGQAQPEPRV